MSKKILDFLLFSNVYVAFPVSFLAWQTYLIIYQPVNWSLLFLIYCSTLFLYCFHRIYGLEKVDKRLYSVRHRWAITHKALFYTVLLFSLVGIIGSIPLQHVRSIIFLIPVAIFSFAYSVPLIPWKGRLIRLRDIPGMKVFFISLAVGYVTLILPMTAISSVAIPLWEILMLLAGRMFFVFSITIPFDIRDMKFDQKSGTPTIPVQFGEKPALKIAYAGLGLFAILTIVHYAAGSILSLWMVIALLLSAVISGWIISKASPKRSEYYFSLLVEGTMIIQTMLVWIATR